MYRVKKGHELEALKPNPSRPDQKIPGGELFFDPNLLSTDGTAALSSVVISHSGKYLAYGVSRSGSDWNTIYVRRTDSPHTKSADDGGARGEDPGRLEDVIRFVKFGQATWLKDDSGLLIWLRWATWSHLFAHPQATHHVLDRILIASYITTLLWSFCGGGQPISSYAFLGFFYHRYPEKIDHGTLADDKAGTEIGADLNAMVRFAASLDLPEAGLDHIRYLSN